MINPFFTPDSNNLKRRKENTMKRDINPGLLAKLKEADALKKRDPRTTLKILEEAEKKYPAKNPAVLGIRSQCYLRLGMIKQAETVARQAISLDHSVVGYGLLTKILLAKNDFVGAEMSAQEAVRLRRTAKSLTLLAQTLLINGNLAGAETAAREAAAMENGSISYGLLAQVLLTKGDLDGAEVAAKKSVELAGCAINYAILGEILRKKKEYVRALSALSKIDVRDQNYHNLLCCAYCLMHLGRFAQSLAQFLKAEESLLRKRLGYFDSSLRLNAGYIFLYSEMLRAGHCPEDSFLPIVKKAAQWIRDQAGSPRISRYQMHDLISALQIARALQL
jgi:Tetratricopeptide repeat